MRSDGFSMMRWALATGLRAPLLRVLAAWALALAAMPGGAVVVNLGSAAAQTGGQVRLLVSGDTDQLLAADFVVRYDATLLTFDDVEAIPGGYGLSTAVGAPVADGAPMVRNSVSVVALSGSGTDYFYLLFSVLGAGGSTGVVELLPATSDPSFFFVDPNDPQFGVIEYSLSTSDPVTGRVSIENRQTPLPAGPTLALAFMALGTLALHGRRRRLAA